MLQLLTDHLATPLGDFTLVADEAGRLHAAEWTDCLDRTERSLRILHGADGYALKKARNPGGLSAALRAYFAGDIAAIDTLPVAKIARLASPIRCWMRCFRTSSFSCFSATSCLTCTRSAKATDS